MAVLNFEFKARASDIDALEQKLQAFDPAFIGEDTQVDTYFNVANGRLKLREGNIENALIWYERKNEAEAKLSKVLLYQHAPDPMLKAILIKTLGIKVVVEKKRKIYFIGHVKFHFDTLAGLGTFVEVEAIDRNGEIGIQQLQQDCEKYASLFDIKAEDYVPHSYSDMIEIPGSWY